MEERIVAIKENNKKHEEDQSQDQDNPGNEEIERKATGQYQCEKNEHDEEKNIEMGKEKKKEKEQRDKEMERKMQEEKLRNWRTGDRQVTGRSNGNSWRNHENEKTNGSWRSERSSGPIDSMWRAGKDLLKRDDRRGVLREKCHDKFNVNIRNHNYTSRAETQNPFNFRKRRTVQGSNNFTNKDWLKELLDHNENIASIILSDFRNYSEAIEKTLETDILKLIIELISTICESSALSDKCRILQITLRENFFKIVNGYISTWLFEDDGQPDCRQHFDRFLINVMIIFDNALQLMPTISWDAIRKSLSLIEINLSLVKQEKNYEFSDVVKEKLIFLKEIISRFEKKFSKGSNKVAEAEEELAPDDDFRTINVYPSTQELIIPERSFIRKNKITGSYDNVKHYLDIHFRLLREDFLNPIREDICDYINKVNRTLFNIKIHKNVKILRRTPYKDKTCFMVQIMCNKRLAEFINSEQNTKRFMNGALLFFTNDYFKTTIYGVIEDGRLSEGQLIVSFNYRAPIINSTYLMVECVIFYEPYYQVLKALQEMSQDYLPMEDYIINVQSTVKSPNYLVKKKINLEHLLNVLNDSQMKAIQGALSQEFVIIQGPPGTGKTFLGALIAKEILELTPLWRSQGPMLVICYTNHALDQFLEKLLTMTSKIVRLGSQTKSEALKEHSLFEIRRKYDPISDNKKHRTYSQIVLGNLYAEVCSTDRFIKNCKERLMNINISIIGLSAGIIGISKIRELIRLEESCFTFMEDDEFISWLLEETSVESSNQNSPLEYGDSNKMREIYNGFWYGRSCSTYAITLMDLEKITNELSTRNEENSEDINEYYEDEDYLFLVGKIKYLKECLLTEYEDPQLEQVDMEDPFNMPVTVRWQLYYSWLKQCQQALQHEIDNLIIEYQMAYTRYNREKEISDVALLKKMKIVGMTTTCAARMHNLLQSLECPIIIVEEAAEILEAHILPVLSEQCQHLIMIGDHKQLKPSTSDYVVDTKYHLGVSLFERMVQNNIPFHSLNVQHRMRPEISSLICPTIYPELEDHKSVKRFPPIVGIDKSVYFVDHLEAEQPFGDSSKMNTHEAKFMIKLAEYLLNNGYSPEDITILTPYTGQVFTLEKERKYCMHRLMKSIEIKALDNFQGEENKIILLSLVRSNPDKKIGFLKLENRICVALSRAREGLYIIGNMTQLCALSQIWKKVNDTLMSQDAVGRFLPLRCHNHNDTVTLVKFPEDFHQVPEGGCKLLCKATLNCGHNCTRYCHITDKTHDDFLCQMPCERLLCANEDHKCKKKCYQDCGRCELPIPQTLACGHTQPVPCYMQPKDFKCMELLAIELTCGHTIKKTCHIDGEKLECTFPCEDTLPNCSHPCIYKCHKNNDPKHEQYECMEPCTKTNVNCQEPINKHKCLKVCCVECTTCTVNVKQIRKTCSHFYDIECHKRNMELSLICRKPCMKILPCNHKCVNQCYMLCGPCTSMVFKLAECGHRVKTKCGQSPYRNACVKPCTKLLSCGHNCKRKCNMTCNDVICFQRCSKILDCGHPCIKLCREPCACKVEVLPKCAHLMEVKCNETPSEENCRYPCKVLLKCGHKCRNKCNEPCTAECPERCNKILKCNHLCKKLCHEACTCEKSCK